MVEGLDVTNISPTLFTYDIAQHLEYPSKYYIFQGNGWMNMDSKKRKKHIHEYTFLNHDISKKEVTVRFNNFVWLLHNHDGVYVSGSDNDPIYLLGQ